MRLPEGMRIDLDPELEDAAPEMRLSLADPAALPRLAAAALELSGREEFKKLWLEDEGWPPL